MTQTRRDDSPVPSRPSPLLPLWLGIWFALATGLAEGGYQTLRRLLGRITHLAPDVVWMAPLANLLWFLPVALGFALVWWRWPDRRRVGPLVLVLAFMGASAVLLLNGRLHPAASLLLGLGVGVQLSRLVARRPAVALQVVRRSFPVLALAVVLAFGWQVGGMALRERRAMAAVPASEEARPNVLLLIIDTARWLDFSLADSSLSTTPRLVRAAAEGTVFTRAFTPAPWTLPAHASIFTGRWPIELSADWVVPLDRRQPTLAEVLREAGYVTGGFVANLPYCSREFGLGRGFQVYRDFTRGPGELVISTSLGRRLSESRLVRRLLGYHRILGRKDAATVNRQLLDWLGSVGQRPYFAFVNYFDVHEPYRSPPEFEARFIDRDERRPDLLFHLTHTAARPQKESAPAEEIASEHQAYLSALAYVDERIGALLDSLEQRGILNHTIVIVTADHGEQFGEHGLFEHGNSFYPQVLQVPLLLRYPAAVPRGGQVDAVVSVRDLAATVLELVDAPAPGRLPGTSLAPLWRAPDSATASATRPVFANFRTEDGKPLHSIIAHGRHYIVNADGTEELYHLDSDPLETGNLIQTPLAAELVPRLQEVVDSVRRAAREGER